MKNTSTIAQQIKHFKGIVAISKRKENKSRFNYNDGNEVFFFNTNRQDKVEYFMDVLGYGCTEYYLIEGQCQIEEIL